MFISFLKLTLRNLMRQKFSSFINIFGLALGFACFIMISLFVYDEMQYDKFQENGAHIYRIHSNTFNPERQMSHLPALLYTPLKEGLAEAREVVRISSMPRPARLDFGEKSFLEADIYFADPAFFDMFSYGLKSGSLEAFRQTPNSILLSPRMAEKYFGEEDPVGQFMRMNDLGDLVVAGVLGEVPARSHLQFTALVNYEALKTLRPHIFQAWGIYSSMYYVLLRADADPQAAGQKIRNIMLEARGMDDKEQKFHFGLQPLSSIYLESGQIESPVVVAAGSWSAIIIFSASALFILLLAGFNYINLTTAKATARAREVGIRKLLGAGRKQLVRYFLVESFIISLIAMILAVGMVEVLSPLFSILSGKQVSYAMLNPLLLIMILLGLVLVVAFFSGIYPSFIMARYRPVNVLKGSSTFFSGHIRGRLGMNLRLRQLLIILQFAISIGLVTASLVLMNQTRHVIANSGFDRDFLLVVRNNPGDRMLSTYQGFKNQMMQYPFVTSISAGENVPTDIPGNQGSLRLPSQSTEERKLIYFSTVDFGYFETLGVRLVEGRTFDNSFGTDSTQAVVLNQAAVRALGIEKAEGVELTGFWDRNNKKVIGVVEDIHFESAHHKVQPVAFHPYFVSQGFSPPSSFIMVRFNSNNISEVVQAMQQCWSDVVPNSGPVEYFFMDAQYEALYSKERQLISVSGVFTLLAIIIACMGLLGTTAFVMEARRKEFGVRKVLGASSWQLAGMISREFTLLIVVSNLIAWPLTWYLMSRWLENFVYRIDLSLWIFAGAGIVGLLLALITVNSLAWRQARRNPVHALKYE